MLAEKIQDCFLVRGLHESKNSRTNVRCQDCVLSLEGSDAVGGIVARAVDEGRNRVHLHEVGRKGMVEGLQLVRIGGRRVQPEVVVLRPKDDRHSVVQGVDQFVGDSGEDGAGLNDLTRWNLPMVPGAGERHDGVIFQANIERLFFATFLPPLVKPSGRDYAAPVTDGMAECRLFMDRLAAGIDHSAAYGSVFGPVGNEPPAHEGGTSSLIRRPDDKNLLCRCDVVMLREVRQDSNAEYLGQHFRGNSESESSAHGFTE